MMSNTKTMNRLRQVSSFEHLVVVGVALFTATLSGCANLSLSKDEVPYPIQAHHSNVSEQLDKHQFQDCYNIPGRQTMICAYHYTESAMSLVDIRYLVISSDGSSVELFNNRDAGQYFCGLGFSTGGKYLYQCFSDEGHTYYSFYPVKDFIHDKKNVQIGNNFEDYYLDHIESFADNGDLIYALSHDSDDICFKGAVETIKPSGEKRCLKGINILPKHQGKHIKINQPLQCQYEH